MRRAVDDAYGAKHWREGDGADEMRRRTGPRRRCSGRTWPNPMAMLLACAAVLHHAGAAGHAGAELASRAIYESVLEATASGVRTPDLGGQSATTGVTGDVCRRVATKLEVWRRWAAAADACGAGGATAAILARVGMGRPCRAHG